MPSKLIKVHHRSPFESIACGSVRKSLNIGRTRAAAFRARANASPKKTEMQYVSTDGAAPGKPKDSCTSPTAYAEATQAQAMPNAADATVRSPPQAGFPSTHEGKPFPAQRHGQQDVHEDACFIRCGNGNRPHAAGSTAVPTTAKSTRAGPFSPTEKGLWRHDRAASMSMKMVIHVVPGLH